MRIVEADIKERGWYDSTTSTVVIRAGMDRAARRSTLAHELVHVEAGDEMRPGLWTDIHEPVIEARADEIAARNLIPLGALVDALQDATDYATAAAELEVDVDMLKARLRCLTEAERWHVEQVTRPRRMA